MTGVQRARGTTGEAGEKTSPDNGGPGYMIKTGIVLSKQREATEGIQAR